MNLKKILSGGSLLTAGHLLSSVCSFLRNVIIARFLSVEDFGIASTFALSLALVEMSSHLALDKLLVQRKDGDTRQLLDSAHSMNMLRGIILGVVLFLCAWPIAYTFNLTEIVWAFQILALAPIFKGFVHLDYAVSQRDLILKPTLFYELIPQILATIILLPLLHFFPDFRAVLIVVTAIPLFAAAISHLQAKRKFRFGVEKAIFLEILHFSWPLMINGILLFFIFQGDRLLVGHGYGMETLGYYSAAFALLMLPTLILQRVLNTLSLPLLSSARDNPAAFNQVVRGLIPLNFVIGGFLGVGYLTLGVWGFDLIFGEKYSPAIPLLYWLGCMQALRSVRSASSIIAMSQGNTKNDMYANLARSIALFLGLLSIYTQANVIWIAIWGVVGEIIAVAVSYTLIQQTLRQTLGLRTTLIYYLSLIVFLAACMFAVHWQGTQVEFEVQLLRFAVGVICLSILTAVLYLFFKPRASF